MKRRFIKQNREIARVNSGQSIRIRNLETEISRLLAENIALREDAINARAEADKWKANHKLGKEVLRMKEQLELKVSEFSELLGELGTHAERPIRRSSQRRRQGGLVSELVKPVEEREQRHRNTIFEQEGRLPAILEDKHYPRRTLENIEIQALVQGDDGATESPDLGPPPVTHFDESEVVTFNATRSPRRTSSELIEESERTSLPSITGGESRRKRRTSILLEPSAINSAATVTLDEVMPDPQKVDAPNRPRPILKTGAKRKLEMSELEDTSRVSKELDDFIFQRKANVASVAVPRQSRFSRPPGRATTENQDSQENRSPERPTRKILAPKSTNSPAKKSVTTSLDKLDMMKEDIPEKRTERRVVSRIRTKTAVIEAPEHQEAQFEHKMFEKETEDPEAQSRLAPKTPAAAFDEYMSPISTEPSTKQSLPREMAVTNSVEDVLNGSIGRGTRRARAPINYAQPNLRDKMRRPGKELVGAVEGLTRHSNEIDQDKSRRSESVDTETARPDREASFAVRSSGRVGSEGDGERMQSRWQISAESRNGKSEPASPLKDKTAPGVRRDEYKEEGAEDEVNTAISRLSLLSSLKSSPMNAEPNDPQEVAVSSRASTTKHRRPSSASGTRQIERHDEGSDVERKGHARKSVSVTSLPPVNQLNHRRIASSSKVANVQIESFDQDVQESRTRSTTLSRRRSMMV